MPSEPRVPINFDATEGNALVWARLAKRVTSDLASRVGGLGDSLAGDGAEATLEEVGRFFWIALRRDNKLRGLVTAAGDDAVAVAPIAGDYTLKIARLVYERLLEIFGARRDELDVLISLYQRVMPKGAVKVLRSREDAVALRKGPEGAPENAVDEFCGPRIDKDNFVFQVNAYGPGERVEVRVHFSGRVEHRLLGQGRRGVSVR